MNVINASLTSRIKELENNISKLQQHEQETIARIEHKNQQKIQVN